MPPLPKHPAARQRRNKSSSKATLSLVVDHKVPMMPNPDHWLHRPDDVPGPDPVWSPAVEAWWEDIWSSPMSNEFTDADIHGLYLACFYLQQTLNPYLKIADRLNASKAYEAAVKNFGLTPMSRRSLQWEVERAEEAQAKGAKRKARYQDDDADSPPVEQADPRGAASEDDENPFDKSPEFAG